MEIISANVGQPREVEWEGDTLTTAIHKEPVVGPVAVGKLKLAGDAQADLSVHGGPSKAVYSRRPGWQKTKCKSVISFALVRWIWLRPSGACRVPSRTHGLAAVTW